MPIDPQVLIPPNYKFAIYAVRRMSANAPDLLSLDPDSFIFREIPFVLAGHWKEWLGNIEAENLSKSNFIFLHRMASGSPEVLDHENQELEKRVRQYFSILFLAGVPFYENGRVLCGANVNGEIGVRSTTKPYRFFKHSDAGPKFLVEADFLEAFRMLRAFLSIPQNKGSIRFKKGLACYWRGLLEKDQEERLHQFVRSIEALLKTDNGKGRKQFRSRGQLFIGRSHANYNLLNDLYIIRNGVEHHLDLEALLHQSDLKLLADIVDKKSLEAEIISRFIYRQILNTPSVYSIFTDEAQIEVFWKKDVADQDTLWPNKITL